MKSLRDSRDKIRALGKHIVEQKDIIDGVNADLARNVELQRRVNEHLRQTVSKYRKPVKTTLPKRGHLILVK